MKKKVLFICIHNSARSQMAEAFLNQIAASSLKPTARTRTRQLNPIVVEAMQANGIDISRNQTKPFSTCSSPAEASPTSSLFAMKPARSVAPSPRAPPVCHWSFRTRPVSPAHRREARPHPRSPRHHQSQIETWCAEFALPSPPDALGPERTGIAFSYRKYLGPIHAPIRTHWSGNDNHPRALVRIFEKYTLAQRMAYVFCALSLLGITTLAIALFKAQAAQDVPAENIL